jgi:hypothetical protein
VTSDKCAKRGGPLAAAEKLGDDRERMSVVKVRI